MDLTTRYAIAGLGAKLRWRAMALAPAGRARLLGPLHAPPVSAPGPRMLASTTSRSGRSRVVWEALADRGDYIDVLAAWLAPHPGAEGVRRDSEAVSRAVCEAVPGM